MSQHKVKLSARMLGAIASGDLAVVAALYTAGDPGDHAGPGIDKRGTLLSLIAEGAAAKRQTQILDWCFRDAGLKIPQGQTLNYELYFQACVSRSGDVFNVLIEHGLDLNAHHIEYFGDALGVASHDGDAALARFLLENGADPNESWGHEDYETAVWAVAGAGPNPSLEVLRLLLDYGWTQKGSAAHIAAAELGDIDALRLLVEADEGPDLEHVEDWTGSITDRPPGTALYGAALRGQEETVAYLLEHGANPNFEDRLGRSCRWAAGEGGNANVIRMLTSNGTVE